MWPDHQQSSQAKAVSEKCSDVKSIQECALHKEMHHCHRKDVQENCKATCGLCQGGKFGQEEKCEDAKDHGHWCSMRTDQCQKFSVFMKCKRTCGKCGLKASGEKVTPRVAPKAAPLEREQVLETVAEAVVEANKESNESKQHPKVAAVELEDAKADYVAPVETAEEVLVENVEATLLMRLGADKRAQLTVGLLFLAVVLAMKRTFA